MKKSLITIIVVMIILSLCGCNKKAAVSVNPNTVVSNKVTATVTYSSANLIGGWASSNATIYFDGDVNKPDDEKNNVIYDTQDIISGQSNDAGPILVFKAIKLDSTTFKVNIDDYNIMDGVGSIGGTVAFMNISLDNNDQIEVVNGGNGGGVTIYKRIPEAMADSIFGLNQSSTD